MACPSLRYIFLFLDRPLTVTSESGKQDARFAHVFNKNQGKEKEK